MRISDWSSDVCSSDLRKVLADAKVRSDKPAPKPYKLVDTHRLFRLVPPQRWQAVALSEGHDPSVAKKLKIEAGRQMLEKIAHQWQARPKAHWAKQSIHTPTSGAPNRTSSRCSANSRSPRSQHGKAT